MIDRAEAVRKFALNALSYSRLPELLSPALAGIGAILMLHRVTNQPGPPLGLNSHLKVTPEFLREVLATVRAAGYRFISMNEAAQHVKKPCDRQPFVAITLDDGYRDNLTEALPVFEEFDAPFAIYVAPGLIDGNTDVWWDTLEQLVSVSDKIVLPDEGGTVELDCSTPRQKAWVNSRIIEQLTNKVPEDLQARFVRELAAQAGIDPAVHRQQVLMNWDEISQIARHPLCTIGAHTMNHLNLKRLEQDCARREIESSKTVLEERLGHEIRHLAFPYGYARAAGEREARLAAQAGFETAVTTRHGVIHREHVNHMFSLPRISVNGRYQNAAYIRTMLSGITAILAGKGRRVTT